MIFYASFLSLVALQTLQEWLGKSDTLRGLLQLLPTIETEDLRDCQKEAIAAPKPSANAGLFNSLKENRPKALIQIATGVGKTYTAVSFIYRLIKLHNKCLGDRYQRVLRITNYLACFSPQANITNYKLRITNYELRIT